MQSFFLEITLIIVLTTVLAGIFMRLRQPLLIAYIIAGIIAGPAMLNLLQSQDLLSTLSQIGIAFLLFIVGLSLNPRNVKDIGKDVVLIGIAQVVLTGSVTFIIARAIGLSSIESFFVSIALTFSSTIIILKLLSDRLELESLFARITIGILIIQDIIAIGALIILSSLKGQTNVSETLITTFLQGILIIALLAIFSLKFVPNIMKSIARSQEFLLLFSIGWCFGVAALLYRVGFSIEAGALLAGIVLAATPYSHEISAKMKPLRDFFIILFFIWLGTQMQFSETRIIIQAIILSLFVVFGKPIIVMLIMRLRGYTERTCFKAGMTFAQISEFSFILIALAVALGHLDTKILSLVMFVGVTTITASTYMILYSDTLYEWFAPYIGMFHKKHEKANKNSRYDVILFGHNRIGTSVLQTIQRLGKKVLIVDFNPDVVAQLSANGYDAIYGDANDSELLNELNIKKTKMVISTIPLMETSLLLIHKVRAKNKKAIIAVVSHQAHEAMDLYDAGATYVIMPHFLGGLHISTLLHKNKLNTKRFVRDRKKHIQSISHILKHAHN